MLEYWKIVEINHYSILPDHQLAVRFPASPRTRCSHNQMNDQREENEHHQIKKFSFAYHNCLLGTL
jgi:hypothetical protein